MCLCICEFLNLIITIVVLLVIIGIIILLVYTVNQARDENKLEAVKQNRGNLIGTNRDFLRDFLDENKPKGLSNQVIWNI